MDRQRSRLSEKNPYWIPEHRYYELKHFCLQYPYWQEMYRLYDGFAKKTITQYPRHTKFKISPTENAAVEAIYYLNNIEMVERCAKDAADDIWEYLLKGVTQGLGYNYLHVPCCKDVYYDIYRKFFWKLSHTRK